MKITVALVLIVSVVSSGSTRRNALQFVSAPSTGVTKTEIDLCNVCVQFSGQAINQLLDIILNAGVLEGCKELCGLLNASEAIDVACNLLCDIVGIKEFVKIIEDADLDPIYFCELLKVCKVFDGGDATITELIISPKEAPKGSKFQLSVQFETNNGTGTGEISVDIDTVDGIPVGNSELMEPLNPGGYNFTFDLATNTHCNPNQEPCEMWLAGTYNVTFAICNGECGSKHPHSKVYDTKTGSFQITSHK